MVVTLVEVSAAEDTVDVDTHLVVKHHQFVLVVSLQQVTTSITLKVLNFSICLILELKKIKHV